MVVLNQLTKQEARKMTYILTQKKWSQYYKLTVLKGKKCYEILTNRFCPIF